MAALRQVTKRTRLVQKRRKRRLVYLVLIFCIFILAYAGLGLALVQPEVAIHDIEVKGNEEIVSSVLIATVEQGLAKTRALLLYGGTVVTYDKARIIKSLLHQHPRLKSAELTIKKLDMLELTVAERTPVAQWCTGAETQEESCYLLDGEGFVFEKLTEPATAFVTYTGDLSGNVLQQSFLHGGFREVHAFVTDLRSVGVTATSVRLTGGQAEVASEQAPVLKVLLDKNLKKTLSYVGVTLAAKEYKELSSSAEGVSYIDLRFGNRVYYK